MSTKKWQVRIQDVVRPGFIMKIFTVIYSLIYRQGTSWLDNQYKILHNTQLGSRMTGWTLPVGPIRNNAIGKKESRVGLSGRSSYKIEPIKGYKRNIMYRDGLVSVLMTNSKKEGENKSTACPGRTYDRLGKEKVATRTKSERYKVSNKRVNMRE